MDPAVQERWQKLKETGVSLNDPVFQKYLEKAKADRYFDWRQPINFWGVVIDDINHPIEDAEVSLTWTDLSENGTSKLVLQSDSNGLFELRGKFGKHLVVNVDKVGYRRCRWGNIGFEFADPSERDFHRPDSNRPVAFQLITRAPMEPTVQREMMEFRAPEGSGTVRIDLLGQRMLNNQTEPVDLVVRATHGPVAEKEGRRYFEWAVEVSVPEGGLQTGTECPPYAPEEGYLPNMQFSGKAEGPPSRDGIEEWFFIRSRNGQHYSRVHLSVSPAPRRGGSPIIRLLQYVLNPSGSRNLEAYSNMNVRSKHRIMEEP